MEKAQKNKWFIIVGLLVLSSIIGINIYADYTHKEITVEDNIKLIGSILAFSGVVLTVVFTSASTKQIDGVKIDINKIDAKVNNLKTEVDKVVFQITESELNDAKRDLLFIGFQKDIGEVKEDMNHKKDIINLGRKIDVQAFNILDNCGHVDIYLKELLTEINTQIGTAISTQYDYGFDEFDIKHFTRKLNNILNKTIEHADLFKINKELVDIIFSDISKLIESYIKEINIIKSLDNGVRRFEFKKQTLKFTRKIIDNSIDTYKNKKITA